MWFRKKPASVDIRYPGLPQTLDGHAALAAVEKQISDQVCIRAIPLFTELADLLRHQANRPLLIRESAEARELAALSTGATLTGLRSTLITDRLTGLLETLHAMAGGRQSCVINLTARALPRQADSLHGGHDEYHAVAGALTPGLCAQDLYRTSHAIQQVLVPEPELINEFLGKPADSIDCPTPSQIVLFGEQRRRIPVLLDRDHPAGLGAVQDQESYFRALAAQRPFFYDHLGPLLDSARREFAYLTGRTYDPVTGYQADDADYLILAQGAIVEELLAAVQILRAAGVRAGVIKLSQLRPFPGASVTQLLQGKKALTILERTDQPLAEDGPLLCEVRAALDKALENGRATGQPLPYPAYPGFRQVSDRPALYSGIYGIGSDLPDCADLLAVYRNMQNGARARKSFYVGQLFGQPDRRFPHLQTLQQKLQHDYPELERLAIGGDPGQTSASAGTSAAIHFLSSQRGVFAVNTLAQALAEVRQMQVRTYPQSGLEQTLQPTVITLVCAQPDATLSGKPTTHDLVAAMPACRARGSQSPGMQRSPE
ncbi:MAG: hypothetical protein HW386_878 [Gammaproteobacteria bacterium]|nr:hypothetical protein [Gammaproteobacteria bacterium]